MRAQNIISRVGAYQTAFLLSGALLLSAPLGSLHAPETPEPLDSTEAAAVTAERPYDDWMEQEGGHLYIVNTNSKRFHEPDCPSVEKMNPVHKMEVTVQRETLLKKGYYACGRCKP